MLNAMAVILPWQALLRVFDRIQCRPYRSLFYGMDRQLESVPVHLPDQFP